MPLTWKYFTCLRKTELGHSTLRPNFLKFMHIMESLKKCLWKCIYKKQQCMDLKIFCTKEMYPFEFIISLKSRKTGRQRSLTCGSFSKCLQLYELGQAEASSLELHLGLVCQCQGRIYWSTHYPPECMLADHCKWKGNWDLNPSSLIPDARHTVLNACTKLIVFSIPFSPKISKVVSFQA